MQQADKATQRAQGWRLAPHAIRLDRLLLSATLALALGCGTVPIADGQTRAFAGPLPITIQDAQARIEQIAADEGWKHRRVRLGRSLLTVAWGAHIGRSVIDYDTNTFSIRYLGSANLESTEGILHDAYLGRVSRLARRIETDAGS